MLFTTDCWPCTCCLHFAGVEPETEMAQMVQTVGGGTWTQGQKWHTWYKHWVVEAEPRDRNDTWYKQLVVRVEPIDRNGTWYKQWVVRVEPRDRNGTWYKQWVVRVRNGTNGTNSGWWELNPETEMTHMVQTVGGESWTQRQKWHKWYKQWVVRVEPRVRNDTDGTNGDRPRVFHCWAGARGSAFILSLCCGLVQVREPPLQLYGGQTRLAHFAHPVVWLWNHAGATLCSNAFICGAKTVSGMICLASCLSSEWSMDLFTSWFYFIC